MPSVWVTGMKGWCQGQGPKTLAGDARRAGVLPEEPVAFPDRSQADDPAAVPVARHGELGALL